jgi:hypothetical protein
VEWASEVEQRIAQADAVVAILSPGALQSEMVQYQLELARDATQKSAGKVRLLSVGLGDVAESARSFAGALWETPQFQWRSPSDTERLVLELQQSLRSPAAPGTSPGPRLEAIGGAVPLDSAFYVERSADHEFAAALAQGESIVSVKGARQVGKTSLLARALQQAREAGSKVVFTDFQKLNGASFESLEKFYLGLAESLATQLNLASFLSDAWDSRRSPNNNFERYLRKEALDGLGTRFVWGMDEVDRLLAYGLGGEVFGLFRSWHNERALEPAGPWSKLTLAISYATEAHLFIKDLAQSPFNIGTRLVLGDFSQAQVADLNQRYGSPIKTVNDLDAFMSLLGGQPFLVRRGLNQLATQPIPLEAFAADDGVFGDHLRRLLLALAKDSELLEAVRRILKGEGICSSEKFYRLRSAGVMVGDSADTGRLRCDLYARYLKRHLL